MGGNECSSMARLRVRVMCAIVVLALSFVSGLTLSGQGKHEWRDYAGGPTARDSLRRRRSPSQCAAAPGRVDLPGRAHRLQSRCRARHRLRPRPGRIVCRARCRNRQAALDPHRRPGLQHPRHELLGEQGRQGPPADFQRRPTSSRRSTRGPAKRSPSFGKDGRVDLREGLDRDPATVNQQTRTPGRVFENLLILGSATNQEYASAPGDIRAFDVRTGALVWTFHTVPRPGEFGYDTWPTDAWKTVGGANNWGEQSIDEKRGIVYVPTGSAEVQLLRRQPARAPTCSATASSRSMRGPASASGTSRRSITTSGTSTTTPRRS